MGVEERVRRGGEGEEEEGEGKNPIEPPAPIQRKAF